MKKLLIIALVAMSFTTQSDFCSGFDSGYIQGYCDAGEYTVCPEIATPVCPIAPVGRNNFEGGFGVGYEKGYARYCKIYGCD